MRISRYLIDPCTLPVDAFADPDGDWDYDTLVQAAGFSVDAPEISIGALTESFCGHPDGSAVVSQLGHEYVAIIECIPEPIRLPTPNRTLHYTEAAARGRAA
jgi:hypothetical protein